MTLEQAIVIETNKAREWKEHNLPDRGDNIHALYAEWLKDLKIYRDACKQRSEWIPVKWHEITEEEREREGYPKEWVTYFDSEMPADGEEILITVKYTRRITGEVIYSVMKDECFYDDGFGLDSGYDWIDDVVAWMPLPERYEAESEG